MARDEAPHALLDSSDFPSIAAARRLSSERIAIARNALQDAAEPGLDVVGFGSLARREMTSESDFDYLVLAMQLPQRPDVAPTLLRRADDLRRAWLVDEGHSDEAVRPPGPSGIFGRSVGAFDLVDKIGLQDDTNHSMTRRMLLLEESVSLMSPNVHAAVVTSALRRYLDAGRTSPTKVPRFLLNDVVRYWRTISVDYQAKVRDSADASGLRYLKLLITRKTLFAGTLTSLLLCGLEGWHPADADSLTQQCMMTPLERLVQIHPLAPPRIQDALTDLLSVVDYFLERSGDKAWRAIVQQGERGGGCPEFDDMRRRADDLQAHLETIFFEWETIRARALRCLVF